MPHQPRQLPANPFLWLPCPLTPDSKLRDSLCRCGDSISPGRGAPGCGRVDPAGAPWEQAAVPWPAPSVALYADCSRGVESHTTVLFAECGFYSFFKKKAVSISPGFPGWQEPGAGVREHLHPTGKLRGTRLPGVPSCCTVVYPPVSPGESWEELAPTVGWWWPAHLAQALLHWRGGWAWVFMGGCGEVHPHSGAFSGFCPAARKVCSA